MSASARVDPDFRSEPSTTDAPRTARFGNPPRRPLLLGLLAAVMLLVGGFGAGGVLVRDPIMTNSPIGFWRYGHGHDLATTLMYGGVALMALGVDHARPRRARATGSADGPCSATAAVWTAPLLLAPPLFTRDIFSYLAQGALPLHGFDPYAVGPDAMPGILTDNVHYFWQDTPAPYGPLFIIVAKTVAWLAGNNIIAGVLLMRLALLPGLALLVWALPELTRRLGGRVPVALWIAVANPMMVVNMIGGGHNDLLVVGFLAAGALLALRGRHAAGIALVTLAMAVKASAGPRPAVPRARLGRPHDGLALGPHRQGRRGGHRRVRRRLRRLHPARGRRPGLAARAERALDDRQLDVDPDRDSARSSAGSLLLFGGSQQLVFVNIFRGIGAAVLLWIAVRQWWAARDGGPEAIRRAGIVLLRHLVPLPRHAALVRELGHGPARDGAMDGARPAVPGRRVDDVGHRLLPQRRGRPQQLGLPRGLPGGGRARGLVAGAARSAPPRRGRPRPQRSTRARRAASGSPAAPTAELPPSPPVAAPSSARCRAVSGAELDAAGIAEPALRAAYAARAAR